MTSVSAESNDPLRCPRPSNDRDNRASVGGGGGGSGPSSIASAMSAQRRRAETVRSEEHTSELQSLMRISYAVFRMNKKTHHQQKPQQLHLTQSTDTEETHC